MKLAEAMSLANEAAARPGRGFRVFLACGFTPQHLKTYLTAHLSTRMADRQVHVESGLYGDLVGSLDRFERDQAVAVAVIIEWEDLDRRLGYRSSQPWRVADEADIMATVALQLDRLRASLDRIAAWMPVCVSLPTLPLPPAFKTPRWQAGPVSLGLREKVDAFAVIAAGAGIRVVDPQGLNELSPAAKRLDIRSELRWHFPYTVEHASVLCEFFARLIAPAPVKKAIITDLDDTLWRGLLGEDGVEGISWDLDHQSHGHAMYQQLLASLADLGVLIGIATKNDPCLVEQALARKDLIVPADILDPVEAHWGPKSESVQRMLDRWNIGSESVVFIDDSALDLAEVAAVFPEIQELLFPTSKDADLPEFLGTLRDLFGKASVSAEDQLRRSSLRNPSPHTARAPGAALDEILSQANAEITLSFDETDQRAFDLVSKTNQFNLNGRRIDEAAWRARVADPRYFVLTAAYQDKFGPLGKIAVASGRRGDPEPEVDIWVMSCRAFSRRIEYQMLKHLFDQLKIDSLRLDLAATDRNAPLREFVKSVSGQDADGPVRIRRNDFLSRCPPLYGNLNVK